MSPSGSEPDDSGGSSQCNAHNVVYEPKSLKVSRKEKRPKDGGSRSTIRVARPLGGRRLIDRHGRHGTAGGDKKGNKQACELGLHVIFLCVPDAVGFVGVLCQQACGQFRSTPGTVSLGKGLIGPYRKD